MGPEGTAADWYVDAVNGSDPAPGQPPLPPGNPLGAYKSITAALGVAGSGDRLFVAPGTYDAANGEVFPLTSTATDLEIYGTGTPLPVITAVGFTWPGGTTDPACMRPSDGWQLGSLRFDNDTYDKTNANLYGKIHAVYIKDLVSSFTARDLEVVESYWGIWIEDDDSLPHHDPRSVTIHDCLFEGQGPVNSGSVPNDRGHAVLMIGAKVTLTATITGCTFEGNHDGIEGGQTNSMGVSTADQTVFVVTDCLFESNENGFECSDNNIVLTSSTFRTNGRFDPNLDGGVSNPYTIALGNRSGGLLTRYTVRRTVFDRNQMAVGLISGADRLTGITFDFGTSPTSDPGLNTFTTDTTNPWPNDHSQSYCGIFTKHPNPVWAVGNTWTYVAGGGANNQGADAQGKFATGTTTIVGPNVNFAIAVDAPPHRPGPSEPQIAANVPWNYSTGLASGSQGGPKIVLEP